MYKLYSILIIAILFNSCSSLKEASIRVFTEEDDPQIVADSFPTMLKTLEIFAEGLPSKSTNFAVGQAYVLYANAFIQTVADQLGDEFFDQKQAIYARSTKFYRRGRNYLLKSLGAKNAQLQKLLLVDDPTQFEKLLRQFKKRDLDGLYWTSLAWLAEISLDPLNLELLNKSYVPLLFIYRCFQIDPTYNSGALHSTLITIISSLPKSIQDQALVHSPSLLGPFVSNYYASINADSTEEKIRHHFRKAEELMAMNDVGLYLTMAKLQIKKGDLQKFLFYIEKALAVDIDKDREKRLQNVLYRIQAQWLLEHKEDYFI